jgi:hypothetical protein
MDLLFTLPALFSIVHRLNVYTEGFVNIKGTDFIYKKLFAAFSPETSIILTINSNNHITV